MAGFVKVRLSVCLNPVKMGPPVPATRRGRLIVSALRVTPENCVMCMILVGAHHAKTLVLVIQFQILFTTAHVLHLTKAVIVRTSICVIPALAAGEPLASV